MKIMAIVLGFATEIAQNFFLSYDFYQILTVVVCRKKRLHLNVKEVPPLFCFEHGTVYKVTKWTNRSFSFLMFFFDILTIFKF